jgi:hypothetical protein
MIRKKLATLLILAAANTPAGAVTDEPLLPPGTAEYATASPLLLAQVSTLYGKEEAWKVEIDIKPGSESKEIPIRTERIFPIAIFGSEQLDITLLNPRTIRISSAGKKLVGRADTRTCRREDLNGDSREDLVCDVKTAAFRLDPGELLLSLEAETYQHQKLVGEATIIVISN